MTIQAIIKRAIKRLELEGKQMTPDFYAEAFCKEASRDNRSLEDCTHVETLMKGLSKELILELKNYRITTMHEFARFLIAKLSRVSNSKATELLETQVQFAYALLESITSLHNQDATTLARKSIALLDDNPTKAQIENFSQLWKNFSTNYDDTFLQQLDQHTKLDRLDLKSTIDSLEIDCSNENPNSSSTLAEITSLLVSSLVPSIASSANSKISDISTKIQENPDILQTKETQATIKESIALRVELDKASIKEMVDSIDRVLVRLSSRVVQMIEKSDESTGELQKIKSELKTNDKDLNFQTAHKKLYTIATALEANSQNLGEDLKSKIAKLEVELEYVKKESKEDFLTKLFNKRALNEFLERKEAEHNRYKRNYSILMFDLDFFKKINDTYGHEAGDAVLVAFAKILKKEVRTVDIVGRYGGEEFLAILGDTDLDGALKLAQKIRNFVSKAKFIYRGKEIKVTVSIGASEREKNVTAGNTLTQADKCLYKAKESGRDRVESEL